MNALRVLLIGTETAEAEHICAVLSDAQHAVVPVPSFEEAAEALTIQKFDAVLITPGFSGAGVRDFTAQLREAEKSQRNPSRTPVLSVLESNSSDGSSIANSPVDAYLPGHFEAASFAQTVENLAQAIEESSDQKAAAAGSVELPVLNVAEFQAQVAYDRELMVEIIDLFMEEQVHDMADMTQSLEAGDLQQLMRGAHTIKGSLGSLHASLARFRSQELESAAKSGNRQACVSLLGALRQDLDDLEPELLSLRATAQPGS